MLWKVWEEPYNQPPPPTHTHTPVPTSVITSPSCCGIRTFNFNLSLGEGAAGHAERLADVLALVLLADRLDDERAVVGDGEATMILAREHEDLTGLLVPEDGGRGVARHLAAQRHSPPHPHDLILGGHQERWVGWGHGRRKQPVTKHSYVNRQQYVARQADRVLSVGTLLTGNLDEAAT